MARMVVAQLGPSPNARWRHLDPCHVSDLWDILRERCDALIQRRFIGMDRICITWIMDPLVTHLEASTAIQTNQPAEEPTYNCH
jgi:hypothetical protein